MAGNVRRVRFEKVAGRRVTRILSTLKNLSKCSNKNNYQYNEADVKKMFKTIREVLNDVEKDFTGQLLKDNKDEFKF